MDPTTTQWRFKIGDQVVSADDQNLGKIVRILPDSTRPMHLIVEKGRLVHHDYRVPVSAVTNYDRGIVYLNLTESAIREAALDASVMEPDTTSDGYIG